MRSPFLPIVFAIVLTSPFWSLGHALWEVDDARYAEVPREMVETGDWLTPQLDYMDYVEKPPLIYWLSAASYRVFGVREAAARVPLALAAILAMLGIWWLGSWLFSPDIGMYGAIILGTSLEFFSLAHIITPDMTVSACLLWATGMILRCLRRPQDGTWASCGAWTAMALAFLSKGLIGLLLPGLWTAGLAVLFPELRKGLKSLLLGPGPWIFLLLVAPWFIAMETRHPGFFHFFFIEQHFMRYLTPQYNRPGPWYYFIVTELVGSLPWTPLALAAVLLPLLSWREADARRKQLALWVWLVLAFFSVSSSKLVTYILPVFAHQSLLAGELLYTLEDKILTLWLRRGALFFASVLALAAALIPWASLHAPIVLSLPSSLPRIALACLAVLSAACAALARGGNAKHSLRALLIVACLACSAHVLFLCGAAQAEGMLSAKGLAQEINTRVSARKTGVRPRLIAYGVYLQGIPYYTGLPMDVVNWLGELHYAKRDPRFAARFGDDNTIRALPEQGRRAFVVLARRDLPYFLSLNPNARAENIGLFGNWALAEFGKAQGPPSATRLRARSLARPDSQ